VSFSQIRVPTVSAVDAMNARQDVVLLDVREPQEWNAGHSPGAIHIPLGSLPASLGRIPRDKKVYVLCRSGNRSRTGTAILRDAGFDAHNVSGGMQAWEVDGGRVLNRANGPGRVI
jgi:rhodanese-related sulfurtransferase